MATYTVIRDGGWDISSLEQIEKQIHLLNVYEQYMFKILKLGIKVTNFKLEKESFSLIYYFTT